MLNGVVEKVADNPVAYRGAARAEHHDSLSELLYSVEDEPVHDSELTESLTWFTKDDRRRTALQP